MKSQLWDWRKKILGRNVRRISFSFWHFFNFDLCERRKKSFSILANSNTKFFFYKIKAESLIDCQFFFSHVCKTHKNSQSFIKLLLKISFFAIFLFVFYWLKIRDIFLTSMKFLLNYHQQNFIYAFFKKMTVK